MRVKFVEDAYPLTLQHVLARMRQYNGPAEVVAVGPGGTDRSTHAAVAQRIDRLSGALRRLGVRPGDRVATLAWNSQAHFELHLAVPCVGAVLHPLNPRLFPDELAWICDHAGDRLLFVDEELAPLAQHLRSVETIVTIEDGPGGSGYGGLLSAGDAAIEVYPELDERQAAALYYTSGTTGRPKGCLYSHRATMLKALTECLAEGIGVSSTDRVLPLAPLFHVSGWGLPYAAALVGATLVLPGRLTDPEALLGLMKNERVTVAAGVPTVWSDVEQRAAATDRDLSGLRVVIGGAPVPQPLVDRLASRQAYVIGAWGLTETIAQIAAAPLAAPGETQRRDTVGRVLPLTEARLVDEDGGELPWDGASLGELALRGASVIDGYFREAPAPGGWLRTGDVGTLADSGRVRIVDRAKDLIKSGGEWIPSANLEDAIAAHPAVAEVAVVGRQDPRWGERPVAAVVVKEGHAWPGDELRRQLAERVARWWIPDDFVALDALPRTSVGKIDKKALRRTLAEEER